MGTRARFGGDRGGARGEATGVIATIAALWSLTAPIEIVYHADLEGQMARPQCDGEATGELDYAAQVAAIDSVKQAAAERGALPPIVLLGGDQIAPDLFVRSILARDGESGARDIAAMLARAGYDAIAIGNHELSAERVRLERFVAAATAAKLPVVASNLTCDRTRQPFCAHLVRSVIATRGADRIGILAMLSPRMVGTIAKPQLVGITVDDLAVAVPREVAALRKQGVATVVVMLQFNSGKPAVDEVLALQRGLPRDGDGRPDAMFASGLADADGQRPTVLIEQVGSPPVIGSSSGPLGVTVATLAPTTAPVVRYLAAESERSDAAVREVLGRYIARYCARYGAPLGTLAAPASRDALVSYTLAVMQQAAHSELAIVNSGLVYSRAFPIIGQLTIAKLKRAMPHPSVVGTVEVLGADLGALLEASARSGRLVVRGAARPRPDAGFEVNGRPIDKTRGYRIAVIDFVARGGDFGLGDQLAGWRPLTSEPDVRDLVEAAFAASQRFAVPPSQRLLTAAAGDLSADLTNTSIANAAGLADAQLARAEQRALKLELVATLALDHPRHRWDNKVTGKYGYARTVPVGQPAAAQETLDLLQLTSLYSYRGLAARTAVPSPYTRLAVESEFTVPASRMFRHAELTQTAGALFTVLAKYKLRAGAGYRSELLADRASPDPAEAQVGGVRWVAEAGVTVDRSSLATFRRLAVTAEGSIDYFLLGGGGRIEHQVRATGKLSVPLLPLLFLTVGVDVFGVDRSGVGRGISFDTAIGLKVHLDKTHQSL